MTFEEQQLRQTTALARAQRTKGMVWYEKKIAQIFYMKIKYFNLVFSCEINFVVFVYSNIIILHSSEIGGLCLMK